MTQTAGYQRIARVSVRGTQTGLDEECDLEHFSPETPRNSKVHVSIELEEEAITRNALK